MLPVRALAGPGQRESCHITAADVPATPQLCLAWFSLLEQAKRLTEGSDLESYRLDGHAGCSSEAARQPLLKTLLKALEFLWSPLPEDLNKE